MGEKKKFTDEQGKKEQKIGGSIGLRIGREKRLIVKRAQGGENKLRQAKRQKKGGMEPKLRRKGKRAGPA